MIYLVRRPISGDVVGMSADEATEYLNLPDHRGLDFRVEMAFPVDDHVCESMVEFEEVPRD